MMTLADLPREAVQALRANRLRSFLTLLGIIIGVATLVGVVSVISGLNGWVQEKVIQLSPDVYVVQKFGIIRSREEFLDAVKRPDISYDDYYRVAGLLTEGRAPPRPRSARGGAVKHGAAPAARHPGPGHDGELRRPDEPQPRTAGATSWKARTRAPQQVVVIGWDVKDELFPHQDPIGHEVLVGGTCPTGSSACWPSRAARWARTTTPPCIIPIQAWRRQWGNRDSVDIVVQARGGVPGVEASIDEVRAVLRALRHTDFRAPDPFGVVTAGEPAAALAADLRRRLHPVPAHRLRVAGRGRDRDHEHHAGGGGGAHARDRRAPGPRRAQARHPPPVPARGDAAVAGRRRGRGGRAGPPSPCW